MKVFSQARSWKYPGPSFNLTIAAVCTSLVATSLSVRGQACGTQGQFCNTSSSCDDGNPCNGTESCSPPNIIRFCLCDPTPPCDDDNECTLDTCLDTPRGLICGHKPGGCSDGFFCNGQETCLHGGSCTNGSPPCAESLLCDEDGDRCVECISDSDCADSNDCTADTCDQTSGMCIHEGCAALFCQGRQLCGGNQCVAGASPCSQPEFCDEVNNTCQECFSDIDCLDDDTCTTATCDLTRHACRINPCLLAFDSPVDGSIFEAGQAVEVAIAGRGSRGLDLTIVLDDSGSLSNDDFQKMRVFATNLVNALPFTGMETGTSVGISMFSNGSRRFLNLSPNQNPQTVVNAINSLPHHGGSTCIGCGIDDAVENWYTNGRRDTSRMMVVLTDGVNNMPAGNPAGHLAGALGAAAFHGQTIVAIGVGDANFNQINQIATDIPGVQTAFYVSDFNQLSSILNAIVLVTGNGTATAVEITQPDGTDTLVPIGADGHFTLSGWSMVPGDNLFVGRIPTPYGELTASLNLVGVCPLACGDLNSDGYINLRDYSEFLQCFGSRSWESSACACGDLQGDTQIDLLDHAALSVAIQTAPEASSPACPLP